MRRTPSQPPRAISVNLICSLVVFIVGCNQPFDPRGSVDQHIVVFTVLSTDRHMQAVRVTVPFMPNGSDLNDFYTVDNSLSDAKVDIWGPGEHYVLRDTVVSRIDTSQFHSLLRIFVADSFTPSYGTRYSVYVSSWSHGYAAAAVVLPGKPILVASQATNLVLEDPMRFRNEMPVAFLVRPSTLAKGLAARLFVNYVVMTGADSLVGREEVPLSTGDTVSYTLVNPIYPKLIPLVTQGQLNFTFVNGCLKAVIRNITDERYPFKRVIFTSVVFTVLQVDPNLFSYYEFLRVGRDPRSMRLDEPMFPTIGQGHYGMIGAYTFDSLVSVFPENYIPIRR